MKTNGLLTIAAFSASLIFIPIASAEGPCLGHADGQSVDQSAGQPAVHSTVHAKGHVSRWDKLVEKSFGLRKGLGAKVMTEEEWAEHKRIMQDMAPADRHAYKKAVHGVLVERLKEMGILAGDSLRVSKSEVAGSPEEASYEGHR